VGIPANKTADKDKELQYQSRHMKFFISEGLSSRNVISNTEVTFRQVSIAEEKCKRNSLKASLTRTSRKADQVKRTSRKADHGKLIICFDHLISTIKLIELLFIYSTLDALTTLDLITFMSKAQNCVDLQQGQQLQNEVVLLQGQQLKGSSLFKSERENLTMLDRNRHSNRKCRNCSLLLFSKQATFLKIFRRPQGRPLNKILKEGGFDNG
jgi:hypothetical protein